MRKNSQDKPYTQEEIETLWKEIDSHNKLRPDLDTGCIGQWSKEDFKSYREWSNKQHELRRLFDLH